jgi:O-antigen/teichoic acid export membrane protein
MKFHWDPSSIATLRGFGRWVFISSILTYVIGQGDRLILGSMMSLDELGYYSVAANVAGMIPIFLGPLYEHVLFPLYAEEGRQTTPEFRRRLKWTRLGVLALNIPALSLLVGAGDLLINLLWDDRYHSAGWMTQVLAAGQLLFAVGRLGPIHFARGESWISLVTEAWRAGVLVASVVIGHSMFGTHGVIGGVALSMACGYPLSVWISRRYGLWFGSVDILAFAGAAVVIGLCGLTRHAMSFY